MSGHLRECVIPVVIPQNAWRLISKIQVANLIYLTVPEEISNDLIRLEFIGAAIETVTEIILIPR